MADDEDKRMPSWGDSVRPFNGEQPYQQSMAYGFLEDYQSMPHQMHTGRPMVPNVQPSGVNHHHHVAPEDNFTVLSLGQGSYLRLYHKDDATKYNNYELFAGSSLHTPPAGNNVFQANPGMPRSPEGGNSGQNEGYTTNMFINQLVGNWAPNVSGTYSPFGEVIEPTEEMVAPPQAATAAAAAVPHRIVSTPPRAAEVGSSPETLAKPFEINRPAPLTENGQSVQLRDAKKPRMVAEVKPMRMTYSDVLSKNVALNTATSTTTATNSTNQAPAKSPTQNEKKNVEKKAGHGGEVSSGKAKKNSTATPPSSRSEERGQNTHQASNNVKESSTSQSASDDNHSRDAKANKDPRTMNKKKSTKNGQKNSSGTSSSGNNASKSNGNRKPKNSKYNHLAENNDEEELDNDEDADQAGFFYNVAKTTNGNDGFSDKAAKASLSKARSRAASSRVVGSRARGDNSTIQYVSRRSTRQKKNEKYVFLQRMLELWMDYLLKALLWLVSLVTDIVWLSYGIVYDKACSSYAFVRQHYKTVCTEVKNSANLHRRFFTFVDRKFAKNSRWAFWRRLFRRQPPLDASGLGGSGGGGGGASQEFYKNGRLPQTGEEAMYSLLNCKGKDAYSILGVSQDCSQEQIRKHYKKIAVLVHPDKNKQPGAEEAFKVLQRAFELIGEPESREAYERNLAEALNAEKAWTELNDLLTQLHAKIAEAANTIRCSSCGLRHPRKPTGRPHYAARECNSCKIRHQAREGDIWAETTFMGFCWKYLALMEGNVYDITEWANCQKGALSHLQPNSHSVQYRIVLGNQQQQQQQQQQNQQQQNQPSGANVDKKDAKKESQFSRPSLDDFLTNLYGGPSQQSQFSSKRRTKKN